MKKLLLLIATIAFLTSCKKEKIAEETTNGNSNINQGSTKKIYYFTSDGVYLNNTRVSNIKASVNVTLDADNNIYDNNLVSVFKNGVAVSTPSSPSYVISCYYVDGNDIYIGGYEFVNSTTRAAYWKNGVKMPLQFDNLSDGYIFIHKISSISKFNGNLYLSGVSRISTTAYTPGYNMLWKNGNFVYPTAFYTFSSPQFPITINGQLVFITKETQTQNFRLYDTNGGTISNYFDPTIAFSLLKCENNGTSYSVYTRILNDIGYLKCRTGNFMLSSKYLFAASCSFNGTDEYVCLADATGSQFNIVYKNGEKMILPTIFSGINISKVIEK